MPQRLKPRRPGHATVVAYLALFLALGAGGAMAASQLAKNSVGPKQLKKNSVTAPKIKKSAVDGAKVKDGSINGVDLADGEVTGAKVADGSLSAADIGGGVRASNVIGVALNADCAPAVPFPPGVSASHGGGKGCDVHFGTNVLNCAVTATVSFRTSQVLLLAERSVQTRRHPATPNDISVFPFVGETFVDLPVDLVLVC
jgi:hypothetical protein